MSAEQTPDIADLVAEEFERHMSRGTSGRWILDYGMTPDDLAAALAPVLAAAVREAGAAESDDCPVHSEDWLVLAVANNRRLLGLAPQDCTCPTKEQARALRQAWSLGQLAGLDDYERNDGTLTPNPYRADRITEPVSHEAATSGEEASNT